MTFLSRDFHFEVMTLVVLFYHQLNILSKLQPHDFEGPG